MGYNIIKNPTTPVADINDWFSKYKDNHLEFSHDQSMMTLATPDESVLVVGPPRLSTKGDTDFHIVGLVNSLQYSETSQVQPMKAIGSRRHIMSKTNGPVQGSIGRLMALGPNLLRALYSVTDVAQLGQTVNARFSAQNKESDAWFANLEEDIFRIPFGLGIIYTAPVTQAAEGKQVVGADYLEVCTLQNKSSALQSGQTFIMEQVTFLADRVVPFNAYRSGVAFDSQNPAGAILK